MFEEYYEMDPSFSVSSKAMASSLPRATGRCLSYLLPDSMLKRSKPVLLCIEDDETQLRLRKAVIEKNGYFVLCATSASGALRMLRESPVSLVIADHMLERITGAELAAEIKTIARMFQF
jgi:PleD family two-component response regulator